MRRTLLFLLALAMLATAVGCNGKTSGNTSSDVSPEQVDVDLTALSSTVVYSEVYNMVTSPEDYVGKVVKMHGQFAIYEDPDTGTVYTACIIADATACCSQGLEFSLSGAIYPDDYPELGTEITVTGTFQSYEEDGSKLYHLADAKMA